MDKDHELDINTQYYLTKREILAQWLLTYLQILEMLSHLKILIRGIL